MLHRWFTDVYGTAHWGQHVEGILGRNTALRRDTLEAIGGFATDVRTGTDYYLGKQILDAGNVIRFVPDSVVYTRYAETLGRYRRQQTRWLRNVVIHGLRFGSYGEVVWCLIPSIVGALMLMGPLLALGLGRIVAAGWVLAWLHTLLGRLRYIRFGEQITGCPFPTRGYLRLPGYALADFYIWTLALAQYPFKSSRSRW